MSSSEATFWLFCVLGQRKEQILFLNLKLVKTKAELISHSSAVLATFKSLVVECGHSVVGKLL